MAQLHLNPRSTVSAPPDHSCPVRQAPTAATVTNACPHTSVAARVRRLKEHRERRHQRLAPPLRRHSSTLARGRQQKVCRRPTLLRLPPECPCQPSGTNYCQIQALECVTAADCPTDWSCVTLPGGCWADFEGNTGCNEDSSLCYPPTVPPLGPHPSGPRPSEPGGSPVHPEDDSPPPPQPAPTPPPSNVPPEPGPIHGGGNPIGGHPSLPRGCSIQAPGPSQHSSILGVLSVILGAALLQHRRNDA